MRFVVTGATGFLGRHVLSMRPDGGEPVHVFVRPTSDCRGLPPACRIHRGDLADVPSMVAAFRGADALLNIASLGFGHAPAILAACKEAGIRRAVFVSTTAIFTHLPAASRSVRVEAERLIEASSMEHTILRPTMIYGTPDDRNIWRLIRVLRFTPVVPLVNGGRHLQQPVHVEDVANAVWRVLEHPATVRRAYNVAGARALTLREMVATIAHELGRQVRAFTVPLRAALGAARLAAILPLAPHISAHQILRLEEDKAFDIEPARAAFGYAPLDFREGVKRELEWLRH